MRGPNPDDRLSGSDRGLLRQFHVTLRAFAQLISGVPTKIKFNFPGLGEHDGAILCRVHVLA